MCPEWERGDGTWALTLEGSKELFHNKGQEAEHMRLFRGRRSGGFVRLLWGPWVYHWGRNMGEEVLEV